MAILPEPFIPALVKLYSNKPLDNPASLFRQELIANGFTPPQTITPANGIIRIDAPEDGSGDKSGWFTYREFANKDGFIVGWGRFGTWRDRGSDRKWSNFSESKMSATDMADFAAYQRAAQEEAEKAKRAAQEEAAKVCREIWRKCANNDPSESEYLKAKGLNPVGFVRYNPETRALLVPVIDTDGVLVSLEHIWKDKKRFHPNGKKAGCFFKLEGTTERIFICEGYATGVSVHLATKATVYVAFDCGNLYDTASHAKKDHPESQIIIAGDDDFTKERNAGRSAAEACVNGLGVLAVYPQGYKDFDDWRQDAGIEAVAAFLNSKPKEATQKKEDYHTKTPEDPNGFLGDVLSYYRMTTGRPITGFGVMAALATASIILGRNFYTDFENPSMLYFLTVGESGIGKEHGKTVIETVLHETNNLHLLAGFGYSSKSAVISTLVCKPRHITIIDEFEKYLKRAGGQNESNLKGAVEEIIQIWGRHNSIHKAAAFSVVKQTKEIKDALDKLYCYCPHITLYTMTTPESIWQTIGQGGVDDGFLNRFLVYVCKDEKQKRKNVRRAEINFPRSIIDWCDAIKARCPEDSDDPHKKPERIVLSVSMEADAIYDQYQDKLFEAENENKKFGLGKITERCAEIALRIAMICALSENPNATVVTGEHMRWARDWTEFCFSGLIKDMKMKMFGSQFEGSKLRFLEAIRKSGSGVTRAAMNRIKPFSEFKPREIDEILQALMDAELVDREQRTQEGRGRPSLTYFAT